MMQYITSKQAREIRNALNDLFETVDAHQIIEVMLSDAHYGKDKPRARNLEHGKVLDVIKSEVGADLKDEAIEEYKSNLSGSVIVSNLNLDQKLRLEDFITTQIFPSYADQLSNVEGIF